MRKGIFVSSRIFAQIMVFLLAVSLLYFERTHVTIRVLELYRLTGSPNAERVLSELYQLQANSYASQAHYHRQKAIAQFNSQYSSITTDEQQWMTLALKTPSPTNMQDTPEPINESLKTLSDMLKYAARQTPQDNNS